MKEYYTEQEQKAIQYLVNNKDKKILFKDFIIEIVDIIALKLEGNKLSVITDEKISVEEFQNLKYSKAEKSLFETICLLKSLMNDNLIELFWYNNNPLDTINAPVHLIKPNYEYSQGEKSRDGKPITCNVNSVEDFFNIVSPNQYIEGNSILSHQTITMFDSSTLDFLKQYFNSFIYPTSLLVELKRNEFLTPEQIRHKKELAESRNQTKWAKFAFWLSFAALIITTIISVTLKPQILKFLTFIFEIKKNV